MIVVVAAVCRRDDGRILVARRPDNKHLGGLWEFPGGKVEPEEDPVAALARELGEEIGVRLVHAAPWTFARHAYSDRTLLLLFYSAVIEGDPQPLEDNPVRWVTPAELAELPVPEADQDAVRRLLAETSACPPSKNALR